MSTEPKTTLPSGGVIELRNSSTVDDVNVAAVYEKFGTRHDEVDMGRMGKVQVLRRNFRFFSIFGYAVILGSTWEYALVIIGISLSNGGTGGAIWMFLFVCLGMFFVMLSMAEMASMAPTSGGQYHWVSELAPKQYQKFLSYIVGWMCVIGWQSAMATTAFITSQQLQGLIALNIQSYTIKAWHTTLFSISITIFAIIWNTVFIRKMPVIEGMGFALNVFGFIAFVALLWAMAPHAPAKEVWTTFSDNSGWGSRGVAAFVGILGPVVTLIGSDSSCHLSEELRDASYILPRAMVATAVANYAVGFIMTVTVMSSLGSAADIDAVLTTRLGQPWIQMLLDATGSRAGTSVMTATMWVLFMFCSVNCIMTTSRQLFAFARDEGVPFSRVLAHVRPGWDVPVNAILVTLLFTTLLSLIIIGSTIAYNVLTSLGLIGLISSYIVVIICIFVKRLTNQPLLPSRFSLGRAGIFINGLALCFLSIAFVFVFFPARPEPGLREMNWSVVMFLGILAFSAVYYWGWGRKKYRGPVEYVKLRGV